MKKGIGRTPLLLTLVMSFLALPCYGQEDGNKPEAYSAIAIGTGGAVGAKSLGFDIRITRYTTDQELQKSAELLKASGPDALRRALEKEDVGRLSPTGGVGNQIAIARKRQAGQDTIITIVTARIMPFMELYRNGRSTDYQFGYLELKLNPSGPGTGTIMAAAKIRFDKKKGQYEIESYGNQYIKATNVRPVK
jgi:hypothetical protein